MKKVKQALVVLSVMAMVIGSTLVVSANEITPKAPLCPNCPNGVMRTTVSYTEWVNTSTTRKCTHYPYGQDRQQTRKKSTTNKCTSCGYGGTVTTTESRWVCHGYY